MTDSVVLKPRTFARGADADDAGAKPGAGEPQAASKAAMTEMPDARQQ